MILHEHHSKAINKFLKNQNSNCYKRWPHTHVPQCILLFLTNPSPKTSSSSHLEPSKYLCTVLWNVYWELPYVYWVLPYVYCGLLTIYMLSYTCTWIYSKKCRWILILIKIRPIMIWYSHIYYKLTGKKIKSKIQFEYCKP